MKNDEIIKLGKNCLYLHQQVKDGFCYELFYSKKTFIRLQSDVIIGEEVLEELKHIVSVMVRNINRDIVNKQNGNLNN